MHVVVAAHDLYPDPGSGGTGRYVYETGRRLVDLGHRVSVVTRRRGTVPDREVVDGVRVRRYDLAVADTPGPVVLANLPRAARAVTEHVEAIAAVEPPTVLSPQGPITTALVARALESDTPRVPTFHSPWPREYTLRTGAVRTRLRRRVNADLRHLVERRQLSRATRLVTLSEFVRERLRDTYRVDTPVSVVPGGVDGSRYAPGAGPADLVDAGRPSILTVRRLSPRMGHELLLSAFATVAANHPDAHLYVAGDGPLRGRLERVAASLDLADRVTFLGYVPDEDLPGVYAGADLFVLPTVALEGFGLATLEALASGTPVVATPVGGTVEVLSGLAASADLPAAPLVGGVDADALASGLCKWARLDPDERREAGARSRRYVTEVYTWERTARRLADLYARAGE